MIVVPTCSCVTARQPASRLHRLRPCESPTMQKLVGAPHDGLPIPRYLRAQRDAMRMQCALGCKLNQGDLFVITALAGRTQASAV